MVSSASKVEALHNKGNGNNLTASEGRNSGSVTPECRPFLYSRRQLSIFAVSEGVWGGRSLLSLVSPRKQAGPCGLDSGYALRTVWPLREPAPPSLLQLGGRPGSQKRASSLVFLRSNHLVEGSNYRCCLYLLPWSFWSWVCRPGELLRSRLYSGHLTAWVKILTV